MYQILRPIAIGPMKLKNRIAYLGMAKNLSTPDNFITDRQIAYYQNYAKNGVALITTGACIVFPDYPSRLPCQPGLYDDAFIPGIRKLADAVHAYGAKLLMQPWHPGKAAYGCKPEDVKACADFTVDEIHEMQDRFVAAAVRTCQAGADGCEWHMAHNYLPEEFAVPLFNKRTDEYGADTIENAARFSVEIIKRIRKECGENFAVTVKINAYDMGLEGGMTPSRCADLCVLLEEAGAQMFSVSAGGGLTDITGMSGDGHREEGWKIPFAETVKKKVSVPVMATGSIRHLDMMESVIRDDKCDLIGMGRGLLAEPAFVRKVSENRLDEIMYCVNCMNCFIPYEAEEGHCSVNPVATYEAEEGPLNEDGAGRKVAVIGGGPAGIEAAITLAKRKFSPVIMEKDGYLGGTIRFAAAPYGKDKLNWMLGSYQHQLENLGIEIRLNTEATAENVKALNPYATFVCTGTNPVMPKSIPGINNPEMVTEACEFLNCIPPVSGEKIAVIGGGLVGLEIAATCAAMGNHTTVVEMLPANQMKITMPYLLARRHAEEVGCEFRYGFKLVEISNGRILLEDGGGEKQSIPAVKVILCMGFKPNKALYDQLSGEMERVVWVGGENGIDNIPKASRRGHLAATNLK